MEGSRITELREALGLTKLEFAAKIGMNDRSLYKWENNLVEIQESSMRQIESTFNVNPEWLRNGKGKMFLPILNPELEPIVEWMKNLSDKESTWLRVDMEQRYELLRKWLKK